MCIWNIFLIYLILYKNFIKHLKPLNKMKLTLRVFVVILALVLTLGIFFTTKVYAGDPPNTRSEIVHENGQWIKYVYDMDGGIVEVIIIAND
jgi:hypothetical protein